MQKDECRSQINYVTSKRIDYVLWYNRLEHAPMDKLKLIECIEDTCVKSSDVCLTCPMARFTKLSYSLSESIVSLHLVLFILTFGGLIRSALEKDNMYFLTLVDNRLLLRNCLTKKPSYAHLKACGCLDITNNPSRTRDKLQARGIPCVFLGYPSNQRGYKLLNLITNKTFITRYVKFYEYIFPCKKHNQTQTHYLQPQSISMPSNNPVINNNIYIDTKIDLEPIPDPEPNTTHPQTIKPGDSEPEPQQQPSHAQVVTHEPVLRRSSRQTKTPTRLDDYTINLKSGDITTKSSAHVANMVEISLNPKFFAFLAQTAQVQDPTNFKTAIVKQEWVQAMNQELQVLETSETWQLTTLPPEKRAIRCKWVFRAKFHANGSVERHKARLVMLGCR